jgi:hypothetical protein
MPTIVVTMRHHTTLKRGRGVEPDIEETLPGELPKT